MTKHSNRTPAHLLQAIFQFSNEELETVEEQTGPEAQQALNTALAALREPAARVCRCFYGIGCNPMTLADIASEFGTKPDRMGRFKNWAVQRLRHISVLGPLALRMQESGMRFTGLADVVNRQRQIEAFTGNRPIDMQTAQFGRDHAPTCTEAGPCPTCRLLTLLGDAGLREQFEELLAEWSAIASLGDDVQLDELELSKRTTDALRNEGLVSLGLITQKTEAELLRLPNFGRKSLNEVKEVLASYGRRLHP